MADQIEVNYDQIKQIGSRFSKKGDELDQLAKRLTTHIDNLRGGGWLGRGADAFYAEMDSAIFPTFTALCCALQDTQQVLTSISAEFARAEEEAKEHVTITV